MWVRNCRWLLVVRKKRKKVKATKIVSKRRGLKCPQWVTRVDVLNTDEPDGRQVCTNGTVDISAPVETKSEVQAVTIWAVCQIMCGFFNTRSPSKTESIHGNMMMK